MIIENVINGFEVSLELDIDEGLSWCWINKNNLSSSLDFALFHGGLFDHVSEDIVPIHPSTIKKIESWALANGY